MWPLQLSKTLLLFVALTLLAGCDHSSDHRDPLPPPASSPTVLISSDQTELAPGESTVITFSFSEPVTDFSNNDVTVSGGELGPLRSDDGGYSYFATFTVSNDLSEPIVIAVTDPDLVPNGEPVELELTPIDPPPSLTLQSNQPHLKAGETALIDLQFSEEVTLVDESAVTVSGGELTQLQQITPEHYQITLIPDDELDGTVVIEVLGSAYVDSANQFGSDAHLELLVSGDRPTLSIISSQPMLRADEYALITFQFDEIISGFELDDISVTNGTLIDFGEANNNGYQATFIPTSEVDGQALISVAGSGYQDLEGNSGNDASLQLSLNGKRPQATLISDSSSANAGSLIAVTLSFNEAVSGIELNDLSSNAGVLSHWQELTAGLRYQLQFEPEFDASGVNRIQLDGAGYQDSDGNNGDDAQLLLTINNASFAIRDEDASLASIEQLSAQLATSNAKLGARCSAQIAEIYPDNRYPEQDFEVDTSRAVTFASLSDDNTPTQGFVDGSAADNHFIAWIGQQSHTGRYLALGYDAFGDSDAKVGVPQSTLRLLDWVMGEPIDFSETKYVWSQNQNALDELEEWVNQHFPDNNWHWAPDSNGYYDLYVRDLDENEDASHHRQALFIDKKPVIVFADNEDDVNGRVLLDLGLVREQKYYHPVINSGNPDQLCSGYEASQSGLLRTVNNLESGEYPSNYDGANCERSCNYNEVVTNSGNNAYDQYMHGIEQVQSRLAYLTEQGQSAFDERWSDYLKVALLIADKYRQQASYPMDKENHALAFSKAYLGDMVQQLSRVNTPAQSDLGYYGQEISGTEMATVTTFDVSHSYVASNFDDQASEEYLTAKVYLLPGVPATITRRDSSAHEVAIRVNRLRENQSIWADSSSGEGRYYGPINVTSDAVPLHQDQAVTISHPYGGSLMVRIRLNGSDATPINVDYHNVAQQPMLDLRHQTEGATLSQIEQFDDRHSPLPLVDVILPSGVELHLSRNKYTATMASVDDSNGDSYHSEDVKLWLDMFEFIVDDTYAQAGYLVTNDRDASTLPSHSSGVAEFCSLLDDRGSMDVSALCNDPQLHAPRHSYRRQHFNIEWKARCGQACAGNPVDTNAVLTPPYGYLIAHEIGHNLQTAKTKIYGSRSTEVSTNIFPYRAISKYLAQVGIDSLDYERSSMEFDEAYRAIQYSINLGEAAAITHPLWNGDDSSYWLLPSGENIKTEEVRRAFYSQLFFIHNSWDVFTKVSILERVVNELATDAANWDNAKAQLGFSSYSQAEMDTISAEDFMAIALSLMEITDPIFSPVAAENQVRSQAYNHALWFETWGVAVSDKAKLQISSNGTTEPLPLMMFRVPANGDDDNPLWADTFGTIVQPENIRCLDGDVNADYEVSPASRCASSQ